MHGTQKAPHFKIIFLTFILVSIGYLLLLSLKNSNTTIATIDSSLAQADTCGLANLATITSPTGYTFTLSCTANNTLQYQNDNRFTFFQLNSNLNSMPYIKSPNSEVKDTQNLSWRITLNRPSQLYLFFRRIPGVAPTVPNWVDGYTRITPDGYSDLTQFLLRKNAENGLLGLYDIWRSNLNTLSGNINFGPASNNVQASPAFSMYLVGIRPQSTATNSPVAATPTAQPTAQPTNPSGGENLITTGVVYNADSSANSSRSRTTTIRVPQNLINPTQSWVALRMRMGIASTASLAPDPNIFDMSESDDRSHFVYYDVDSDSFHFERNVHAGGTTMASGKQTFSVGDYKTVIAAWTATQLKLSIDGGTFSVANSSSIPAQAAFQIGSSTTQGAVRQPNSDYVWVAAGTGTLTDANAQSIHAFGNIDHARGDFPGNATFIWDASSDRYNNR